MKKKKIEKSTEYFHGVLSRTGEDKRFRNKKTCIVKNFFQYHLKRVKHHIDKKKSHKIPGNPVLTKLTS